jgi:tRNA threonylcarbamoyladenosine biosynthesis protein TsaE
MPNHNQRSARLARFLADEAATLAFGARLAQILGADQKVYLRGELGAGKTTLVRGILRGFGYQGKVKSPTFTLLELYEVSSLYLYHFDFYRFADPYEWDDAGFREFFSTNALCIVEWPEKVGRFLPPPDLEIRLRVEGNGRRIEMTACTGIGSECLANLQREDLT